MQDEVIELRAERQLCKNGYRLRREQTGEWVLLELFSKLAIATPGQDGRWTIRGCEDPTRAVVADSPQVGFLEFLEVELRPASEDDRDLAREKLAGERLDELGYDTMADLTRNLVEGFWLTMDRKTVAVVERAPDGRWRAKSTKAGLWEAMQVEQGSVYDTGPLAVLCRAIGNPLE